MTETTATAGSRVQYKDRTGTVDHTFDDYYGSPYLSVRWDNAKRRSNVAAANVVVIG